jgi:hypothetical protein
MAEHLLRSPTRRIRPTCFPFDLFIGPSSFPYRKQATCQQAALATASINISYRLRISSSAHSPMVVSAHSHAPFVPAMDNYFLELKFPMLLYSRAGAFERFHRSRAIEHSNSDETSNDTPLWTVPVNLRLNDRDTGIVLYGVALWTDGSVLWLDITTYTFF